jgi:riboflavin transporter FmnP
VSNASGTHTAGIVLMILAGILVGGAWSLFTRQPRTTGYLVAALVVAVVAVVLFFSGVTRVG